MRNLFETDVLDEMLQRVEMLNVDSKAQWGKMSVAQMMLHCRLAVENALGEHNPSRSWVSYVLVPFWKHKYYGEQAF